MYNFYVSSKLFHTQAGISLFGSFIKDIKMYEKSKAVLPFENLEHLCKVSWKCDVPWVCKTQE